MLIRSSGVFYTGGSLNPARSFGPDVINGKFDGYHWIYWVGPALGSLIAVVFYRLMKTLEYETANPGQDFDDKEDEVFQPDEDPASAADVRRPNVAVGSSEYIADESGIHASPTASRSRNNTDPSVRPGSSGQRLDRGRYDYDYNGTADPTRNESAMASSAVPKRGRSGYHNGPNAENGMM